MEPTGTAKRLFDGLRRTRAAVRERLQGLFGGRTAVHRDEILDGLEEALLLADVGPSLACDLIEAVRQGTSPSGGADEILSTCRARLLTAMEEVLRPAPAGDVEHRFDPPEVQFFVGSHGVGKTTTVGRLAHRYRLQGRRVLVAGSDTHRAAAGEQAGIWAERAAVDFVTQQEGADAAAVVHDALQAARARQLDLVLVDTAGRMHSERNPMEDLKKMVRVAGRVVPGAPHHNFLVIDAGTGQNGLRQAEEFRRLAPVDGVVLTKLDGTAKGGIALSIGQSFGIPIRYVGVGEGIEDLIEFEPRAYLEALLAAVPTAPAGAGTLDESA